MISITDQNIVEVAELAQYLAGFDTDPRIPDAIARIREKDGYLPRFFELAMAHRWKLAGAVVSLEPEIPKGLADFDAVIGDERFVVECASFPGDVVSTRSNLLAYSVMKVLAKYHTVDVRTTTEVRVTTVTPGDFDGAVRKAVRGAARGFARTLSEATEVADFGSVRIVRTEIGNPDHAEWSSVAYQTDESDPDGPGRQVICVSMPAPSEDRYEKVVQKFREECSQLGGVVQPRVILLDVSGLTPDVRRTDLYRLRSTLGEVLLSQPKVASVWIVSRGWSSRIRRFRYRAIHMGNPKNETPLPTAFLKRLSALEQ